tara:strand:- start:1256 stop:1894 length:639 start_codon:yes stop_codon:yes gene_type:complete
MKTLELFSGTGSVGKIADEYGQTISVDITNKFGYEPTHLESILTWDYKQYPTGYFDLIWASPPCASFSSMLFMTKSKDEIQNLMDTVGLPLLYKTLEIIDYFKPNYYCIENPDMGRMKNYMDGFPFKRVSYCQYGYNYRKNTRLWTNIDFEPKFCNHKGKHINSIGSTRVNSSSNGKFHFNSSKINKIAEKYSIPNLLINDIFNSIQLITIV